jgi:hypothetical protein
MVGTAPNQGLGKTIGDWISRELKYDSPIQTKSDSVTVSSALSRNGNKLNFIFNWSWDSVEVEVKKDSFDVETQKKIPSNSVVRLNSWGAKVLLEE